MELIEKALEFETRKMRFPTTSDRIMAAREAKELILNLNEIYKKNKDEKIMEVMKRLTLIKQRIERRLKGKPLTS
ncbi:hypothetical protein [Polaribacter sp. HL-MS24]|uniref:hypothetical protein n=1 Tax=Polaribacter sp. HL-MS24 TaxID=3077735 RepID=UPI002934298E|nr:hypothetical protein [Polaribacter sp. HL-MS24]WOC40585.1 hypothetical protein RRF69_01940 [Polaribacter sp. HL-MS24]